MLDANALAGMRIRPARDIAGGVDAGRAGLEIAVDDDAAIEREAGLFGQRKRGRTPMPTTTRSASRRPPLLSVARAAVDRGHGVLEMEDDAMLFVQRAHEIAHLRPEHALHRPLFRRHHMNLDVARAQRRRDLQPDEARTDDNRAARTLGARR